MTGETCPSKLKLTTLTRQVDGCASEASAKKHHPGGVSVKLQEPTFVEVLAYVREKTPLAYERSLNIPACRFLDDHVAVIEEDLCRYYAGLKILEGRVTAKLTEKAIMTIDDDQARVEILTWSYIKILEGRVTAKLSKKAIMTIDDDDVIMLDD